MCTPSRKVHLHPPHTLAAAYVCMCALLLRRLTSAVCSCFVARVLNCKDARDGCLGSRGHEG
jgi:hypothetical protein